jgi:hypothetical protein
MKIAKGSYVGFFTVTNTKFVLTPVTMQPSFATRRKARKVGQEEEEEEENMTLEPTTVGRSGDEQGQKHIQLEGIAF